MTHPERNQKGALKLILRAISKLQINDKKYENRACKTQISLLVLHRNSGERPDRFEKNATFSFQKKAEFFCSEIWRLKNKRASLQPD